MTDVEVIAVCREIAILRAATARLRVLAAEIGALRAQIDRLESTEPPPPPSMH